MVRPRSNLGFFLVTLHGTHYDQDVSFTLYNTRPRISRKLFRTSSQYWFFFRNMRLLLSFAVRSRRLYKRLLLTTWNGNYHFIQFFKFSNNSVLLDFTKGSYFFFKFNLSFWFLRLSGMTLILINFVFLKSYNGLPFSFYSSIWRNFWKFKHFRTRRQPLSIMVVDERSNYSLVLCTYRLRKYKLLSKKHWEFGTERRSPLVLKDELKLLHYHVEFISNRLTVSRLTKANSLFHLKQILLPLTMRNLVNCYTLTVFLVLNS